MSFLDILLCVMLILSCLFLIFVIFGSLFNDVYDSFISWIEKRKTVRRKRKELISKVDYLGSCMSKVCEDISTLKADMSYNEKRLNHLCSVKNVDVVSEVDKGD